MKVTAAAIHSAVFASSVAALNEPTFQFRIANSKNTAINGSFITLKNDASSSSSEPNPIGIWLSDGVARTPYQAIPKKTQNSRIFEIWRADGQTKLTLFGLSEAMNLLDATNPAAISVAEGQSLFYNKWILSIGMGASLRHAQDYKDSNPTGGAGSWRACKSETGEDYQLFWYDGSSPLPYKNCEGVGLDIVTVDASSTKKTAASATASATASSSSATGVTLTGVAAPTGTSATLATLTGVTAPTSTSKASSNSTSSTSSTATSFQGGAAPKSLQATGLAVAAIGAFAFML